MSVEQSISCQCCGNTGTQTFVDNYKNLLPEDEKFFSQMFLLKCQNCAVVSAFPKPNNDAMSNYYGNVYRKKNRPHAIENPEDASPTEWQKSQLSFLTTKTNFSEIAEILDIGPGYGLFLKQVKRDFPTKILGAIEPDVFSSSFLRKNQITCFSSFQELRSQEQKKWDLVFSSHSLEHWISPLEALLEWTSLQPKCIFIEVPNCNFDGEFKDRPYDGPHLWFFTKKSLEILLQRAENYTLVFLDTCGIPIAQDILDMKYVQKKFTQPSLLQKISRLFPRTHKKYSQFISQKSSFTQKESAFFQYGEQNQSCLRALLVHNSHLNILAQK
jgi:Methyltransferase domain